MGRPCPCPRRLNSPPRRRTGEAMRPCLTGPLMELQPLLPAPCSPQLLPPSQLQLPLLDSRLPTTGQLNPSPLTGRLSPRQEFPEETPGVELPTGRWSSLLC